MWKLFFKLVRRGVCLLLFLSAELSAQEKWTLEQCIGYALEHNVDIKQAELSSQIKDISVNTARNSILPSVTSSLGHTNYFGRGPSRDGTYTDNSQMSSNLSLSAALTLFSGFRIKHDIKSKTFDFQASLKDLESTRDNVSLNITSLFLQVLLCRELVHIAENQVNLSRELVDRNELLVKTGKSLRSQLLESKSLLAKDRLTLIQRENELKSALLNLSQAINWKDTTRFDVFDPELDSLSIYSPISNQDVTRVYEYALKNRSNIKAEKLRLQSSMYNLSVAKSARYPQVSLSGGYSNSYYYSFVTGYNNVDFVTQLKNNGNEYIGINISIPIFNRLSTRNQIRTAQTSLRMQELVLDNIRNSLRKEIEQACQNADAALQKYLTAIESWNAATETFRYTAELSKTGRATVYDYNNAKTDMERSESEMVQSKYELIFSRKILDFYAGIPLVK